MIQSSFVRTTTVLLVAFSAGAAFADDEPPPDKSGYTLFNPVPDDKLRDFSSDRPGKAQSSITVDAGRVQIESDFVTYAYDPRGPGHTTTREYAIGVPVLKLGVTDRVDIEIGTTLFDRLRTTGPDGVGRASGFGDTLLGAKVNVFGNDGGDQSLALIPVFKLPTAARGLGNDHVEFMLNAPYTVALPKQFSLTLQPGVGLLRNSRNEGYRDDFSLVASLSRPVLIEGLTAAIDVAVEGSSERKVATQVSIDPALAYQLTKNLQLDVGVFIGLNKATPRTVSYAGISYRF